MYRGERRGRGEFARQRRWRREGFEESVLERGGRGGKREERAMKVLVV